MNNFSIATIFLVFRVNETILFSIEREKIKMIQRMHTFKRIQAYTYSHAFCVKTMTTYSFVFKNFKFKDFTEVKCKH